MMTRFSVESRLPVDSRCWRSISQSVGTAAARCHALRFEQLMDGGAVELGAGQHETGARPWARE